MRPIPTLITGFLLFLAASCGGSDPGTLVDEGSNALTKDPKAALVSFDEALAAIDATHPRFLEASLGKLRAQSFVDPTAAKDGFLAFAGERELKASDYRLQVDAMYTAAVEQAGTGTEEDKEAALGTIGYAIDVLAAGGKAFPEDPKWEMLIKKVGDKAKNLGAAAGAMKALEGLGYVGGD